MSFINLLTEHVTWSPRQLRSRSDQIVRGVISANDQDLLNLKVQGANLDRFTLTADDFAAIELLESLTIQSQAALADAVTDNELLGQALAYEKAERDLSKIGILISGVPEVPMVPAVLEVLEELDPNTFEVIVVGIEAADEIPAIPAIDPLATEIDSFDDNGLPIVIPNPVYTQATNEALLASAVIAVSSVECVELVALRA